MKERREERVKQHTHELTFITTVDKDGVQLSSESVVVPKPFLTKTNVVDREKCSGAE
jgi:hypothetical protein